MRRFCTAHTCVCCSHFFPQLNTVLLLLLPIFPKADGDLVVLDSTATLLWSMGTGVTGTVTPSYAHMQNDGQLCVYRAATAELALCVGGGNTVLFKLLIVYAILCSASSLSHAALNTKTLKS
jgi:hypothetical protein